MKTLNYFFFFLLVMVSLSACKKNGDTPDPGGNYTFKADYAIAGGASGTYEGINLAGGASSSLDKYEAGKARAMGIASANNEGMQIGFGLADVGENVDLKVYSVSSTAGVEATASFVMPGTGTFVGTSGELRLTDFDKISDSRGEISGSFSFTGTDLSGGGTVTISGGTFEKVGVVIVQ